MELNSFKATYYFYYLINVTGYEKNALSYTSCCFRQLRSVADAGPIFGSNLGTLKDGKVLIPDGCYKIVLRVDQDGSPHTLAFEMPQDLPMGHEQRDLIQYLTTITKIEQDTGIGFFPDLPDG